ncbi:MAG: nitroreductase family deazaflavin-dependent oxidoreductase [Candidatus Binatia bacterium]|nr:nitroreductase family deazaflavin-dependent oxidoreductase [Candidatus Binatia bacterium]
MDTRLRRARSYRFVAILTVLLCAGGAVTALVAQETSLTPQAALEKVANYSTVEITTIGRKTGRPHTKPIWFVYDQGRVYIQSGKGGKTDWYQNLQKNPQIALKFDTLTLRGTAKFITDPQEVARIHGLFRSKYLTARMAGLVGSSIGHGEVVEVELAQ